MQPAKKTDNGSATAEGTHFGGDTGIPGVEGRGQKVRAMLKAQLGDDIYGSWFNAMEFDSFDGRMIKVSVPVKFVRNWIQAHYADQLVAACQAEFKGTERVEVIWRQPGNAVQRQPEPRNTDSSREFGEPQRTTAPDMRPSRQPFARLCRRAPVRLPVVLRAHRSIRAIPSTASSSVALIAWHMLVRPRSPKPH